MGFKKRSMLWWKRRKSYCGSRIIQMTIFNFLRKLERFRR